MSDLKSHVMNIFTKQRNYFRILYKWLTAAKGSFKNNITPILDFLTTLPPIVTPVLYALKITPNYKFLLAPPPLG